MSWWTKYTEVQVELAIANALAGGGPGTPSAPVNSIQFNNAGAFGGDANLTWDGTVLTVGGSDPNPLNLPTSLRVNAVLDNITSRAALSLSSKGTGWGLYSYQEASGPSGVESDVFISANGGEAVGFYALAGVLDNIAAAAATGMIVEGLSLGSNATIVNNLGMVVYAASASAPADVGNAYTTTTGIRINFSGTQTASNTAGLEINPATMSSGEDAYAMVAWGISGTGATTATGLRIGNITGGATNYAIRTGAGIVEFGDFIQGTEQSEPAAPAANGYRIFAKDTGGKTELLVRFNSGASQQIAIEP